MNEQHLIDAVGQTAIPITNNVPFLVMWLAIALSIVLMVTIIAVAITIADATLHVGMQWRDFNPNEYFEDTFNDYYTILKSTWLLTIGFSGMLTTAIKMDAPQNMNGIIAMYMIIAIFTICLGFWYGYKRHKKLRMMLNNQKEM